MSITGRRRSVPLWHVASPHRYPAYLAAARVAGKPELEHAQNRFGLDRFGDWEDLVESVCH